MPGLFVSMLASCIIISAKKFYWFDELFSYYLIADPSLKGMFSAFGDSINNTPIVYFVLGWLWSQIFGSGELSLRLLSSATMLVAAGLTWILLRRNYSAWATNFAVVCVFTLSVMILRQNAEARMYGLFLAIAALILLQFDHIYRQQRCSTLAALGIACSHALLLHTHLFGIFYSATIIAAGLLVDHTRRRSQPWLYFAYAAAWLSLLTYIPVFLVQADAGYPRTWIPIPSLGDLAWFYTAQLSFAWQLLLLLTAIYLWRLWTSRHESRMKLSLAPAALFQLWAARPTQALAACLLVLPLGIWLLSLIVKPIFIDRYMIPTLLSISIFLAHIVDALEVPSRQAALVGGQPSRVGRTIGRFYGSAVSRSAFLTVCLVFPIAYALQHQPLHLQHAADHDFGHTELPIVIQEANTFLQNIHYDPDNERYVHLLDWPSAVAAESGTFPPQEYKHMQALLRQYPERFEGQIVESDAFLNKQERFIVIDYSNYDYACLGPNAWYSFRRNINRWRESLQCPRLLEERILADPRYQVTELGFIPRAQAYWGAFTVLLIERRGG